MKTTLIPILALLIAAPAFADDTNAAAQVKAAVAKLRAQPNYSWTVKVDMPGMPFTPEPIEGKTGSDSFTLVSEGMNGNTVQAVLKGDKIVVKLEDDWQLVGTNATSGGDPDFAVIIGQWLGRHKTAADEAENLVAKANELKAGEGGMFSADLTEKALKELLTIGPRGKDQPEPKDVSGSVKLWLKDGELTKFVSHIHGRTIFGPDQQEQEIDLTRTVEIHDKGTTKLEVPAEAKKKLESN